MKELLGRQHIVCDGAESATLVQVLAAPVGVLATLVDVPATPVGVLATLVVVLGSSTPQTPWWALGPLGGWGGMGRAY